MLWLSAFATGEARFRDWARRWTERLRPRAKSDTVFRGFLFYYGAALGDVLLADPLGREVGLLGARELAGSYNPRAQALPLGSEAEEAHAVGRGEANVDTVQSAALLLWAERRGGGAALRDVALGHARRHVEFCLRDDDSVCQSASFDPATGTMLRRYTHKGITDHSTWARAQAWAILGWTVTAQWSGDGSLLGPARRAADWWLAHAPADRVSFWDFDDPAIPAAQRDTSATAIVTASLLKLAALSHGADAERYRESAEATARALVERHLREDGVLADGCYNTRIGLATRHELIWGSYFFYEALHVLSGALDPLKV
jgi:unsaturated chondroitin disaccharide hydrolase